jgi:two-component system, OmpR family, sensor histidine kinase CpxA
MRSLYMKIFLWFWLAMVLVGGTLVFSIIETQSEYTQALEDANDKIVTPPYAERYVTIFEEQGKDALANYIARGKEVGAHVYLFGEDGKEELGQSLPSDAKGIVQIARGTDQTQITRTTTRRFVAQKVTGSSGNHYVFLVELTLPFVRFFWARPHIQAFRLILAIFVGGIVCLWLARYITAPVEKLRAAARQLADGNLSSRIGSAAIRRKDELGDLERDFDRMAERIESLMSSQQRLIQSISHELRSPLARLNVALGLARKHVGTTLNDPLERIEREAVRLNELIGNLLTLARWESGAEPMNRGDVELDALVREVAADADFEARSRNRAVRVVALQPCSIPGMRDVLRSAIENVMRNAVNYTRIGSEVEVTLELVHDPVQESAVIRVRDHGDGVPNDALDSIFRPFYRVANSRERASGGTGLGLSIAAKAVSLHGGQVKAENSSTGGLLVELRFPLNGTKAELGNELYPKLAS